MSRHPQIIVGQEFLCLLLTKVNIPESSVGKAGPQEEVQEGKLPTERYFLSLLPPFCLPPHLSHEAKVLGWAGPGGGRDGGVYGRASTVLSITHRRVPPPSLGR